MWAFGSFAPLPLEGGSNRDCGVEVTKTNEMASKGANICPSFIMPCLDLSATEVLELTYQGKYFACVNAN